MTSKYKAVLGALFSAATAISSPGNADTTIFEDFGADAQARWEFIADGVMGGVSDGRAEFSKDDSTDHVRLTGTVSTENNGGFIQVRRLLPDALPAGTKGLSIDMRGNGEAYYVFVRTKEMTRPWYYYNATFQSGSDWSEVHIPFTAFERSHSILNNTIDPQSVISIGFVAYGRDHAADLSVASVKLY